MTQVAQRVGRTQLDRGAERLDDRELPFPIRASKLRPVAPRRGTVPRRALLDRLQASETPVIVVMAPAGYGKTTLLSQWVDDEPGRVAWLSGDDGDDDPVVLCTAIAAALDRLEPLAPGVFAALGAHRPAAALLPPLLTAFEAPADPVTLIIDNLDSITNPECLDLIGELASRLPEGARLVVASRAHPPLPLARMRVEGRLLEIGVPDLALDVGETYDLLAGAGVEPSELDVPELRERTEGWPAGLYLAALAAQMGGRDRDSTVAVGDSQFLSEYLRAEVLDQLSPDEAAFLIRTSFLDGLTGSLCDAVLETTGSADRLAELEGRSLLVFPLDGRPDHYRYHRLFSELLRRELQRREPDLVPQLHARAAAWCQEQGHGELALRHAQAAKDSDRVAALVEDLMQPAWASGRAATVLGWLEWLADEDLLDRYPTLTVHGALQYALLGLPAQAEVWAAAAERSTATVELTDGSSLASMLAYMRAFLCRDGIEAMRADSIASYDGLSPTSPYRTSMLFAEGLSHLLDDEPEQAEPILVRSADAAVAIGADPVAAMVLTVLGTIAADREDWEDAKEIGDRALQFLAGGATDEYWTAALVFAFGARLAVHADRLDLARDRLTRAARLRPLLTYALPVVSTMALIEMARVYVALADPAGAVAVLRQAHGILQQRPALGRLGPQVEELHAQVDAAAGVLAGGSSLTAAELRLAPLLATRLTLQEIGERLYIARSTVKTQAISIYRKLGVTSRREAVDKLHEVGMIVR